MQIEIINPLDYSGWDELLLTNEKYSFFHSSSWARVLREAYGYEPLYFTSIEKGKIATLIPVMGIKSYLTGKRGVSLPFTDCCEPIISQNIKVDDLWNSLVEYGKKTGWGYLEIRGGDGFGQDTQPSSWYYEHVLDLSQGAQKIHSLFRDSNKRNIKKAQKVEVEVALCDSFKSIKEFYRLNCLTRKTHGLPPQPYSFFKKIYEHIISKKHALLVIARYHEKAIAASMSFHFGEKAIFKYGASDAKYHYLKPNNLVMWKTLEWYCQNGYNDFSFGRTDPDHMGLRQFKAGWGGKERKINYYRYDYAKKNFVSTFSGVDGWHTKVFNKMPVPFLKVIGSILYKHMG